MISLLPYILVPSIVVFFISYSVVQKKQAAQQLKKQQEYDKRIKTIKASFRSTLELFSMQRIIRPTHVSKMYNIVNNYFVGQQVNEQSMRNLEKLANCLAMTIAKEVNMSKTDEDTEWVKKKLLNFAILLPTQSKDFNRGFYNNRMKTLLRGLNTTKSTFIQRHAA